MQRHKYDYDPQPDSAGQKVARMVGDSKRVLELGTGPGAVTKLLHARKCRVTALELDPAAIEIVTQYCEQVLPGDLNSSDWPGLLKGVDRFEAIVAADVLEHLYDPWETLRKLAPLLAQNGNLVVSLPHVGHSVILACLLKGDFDYQPWGLLDKTHIRFFGINNIQKLFQDAGFKIVGADFVVKEPWQTEFAKQWRQLPHHAKRVLSESSFGMVYQVVIKAVPLTAPGDPLELMSLPVPSPSNKGGISFLRSIGNRAFRYLVSPISLETRQKVISRITKGLSR